MKTVKENYNDSESCKLRIREENRIKKIQFSLYLEKCRFIYDTYIDKKAWPDYTEFWNNIFRLNVNWPKGAKLIAESDLKSKWRKIYNEKTQKEEKQFFHYLEVFPQNFLDIYGNKKIEQGILDSAPIQKIDPDLLTGYANIENVCQWNKKNLGVGAKLADKLIKHKITTFDFMYSDPITGKLPSKKKPAPKKSALKLPAPKKTAPKKTAPKILKRKNPITFLTFDEFRAKFFADDKMGNKNSDGYYTENLAREYYKEYIESGLSFKEYSEDTEILMEDQK